MRPSSSPCAACKFLRRKCTLGCVFAPYFPPDQPHKFAYVHRVFGASNVGKILNDIPPSQRTEAVNSLAYEAEARLRDPVYGCVGYISLLHQKLQEVRDDLFLAKQELSTYLGPAALGPLLTPHQMVGFAPLPQPAATPFGLPDSGMGIELGLGLPGADDAQLLLWEQQQQQQQQQMALEAQQMALAAAAEAARENEIRSFESSFDARGETRFSHVGAGSSSGGGGIVSNPSSELVFISPHSIDSPYQLQQQQQQYAQGQYAQGQYAQGQYAQGQYAQGQYAQEHYAQGQYIQAQYTQGHHRRSSESEDFLSSVGPSTYNKTD